jgi:uncharacterized protein with NRDE domain
MHLFDGQIAGKDLVKGGSWLSFACEGGRFAFLTNVRVPLADLRPDMASRGVLVTRFVRDSRLNCDDFLQSLESTKQDYASYNIVFGDLATGRVVWYTNHIKRPISKNGNETARTYNERYAILEGDTTYCVSNDASINTPAWPKVLRARAHFDNIVRELAPRVFGGTEGEAAPADELLPDADEEKLFARLFDLLSDCARPDPSVLPYTGVAAEFELALSSIFVRNVESMRYGTVSSCVAHVDALGPLRIVERSHRAGAPSMPITVRHARHMHTPAARAHWPVGGVTSGDEHTSANAVQPAAVADGRLVFVGDVHA